MLCDVDDTLLDRLQQLRLKLGAVQSLVLIGPTHAHAAVVDVVNGHLDLSKLPLSLLRLRLHLVQGVAISRLVPSGVGNERLLAEPSVSIDLNRAMASLLDATTIDAADDDGTLRDAYSDSPGGTRARRTPTLSKCSPTAIGSGSRRSFCPTRQPPRFALS